MKHILPFLMLFITCQEVDGYAKPKTTMISTDQPVTLKTPPIYNQTDILKEVVDFVKIPVLFPAKMIDQQKGFADKPAEEVGIQFGEYLANSCVGCNGMDYKGGPIPGADPSWPPASNIRLGANSSYSLDSFREMIKTGVSPSSKQELKFPMPIWLLKEFNDKEIESLWIYLSSLK